MPKPAVIEGGKDPLVAKRTSRSVTLREVAKRAEVSTSTASRVLNGGAVVRSPLADRVRQAAAELGYRTNYAARTLRRAQSMTFGAVFFRMDAPAEWETFRGLEREARQHGYATVTADAGGDEERFAELFTRLVERQSDAVFVYRPPRSAEALIDETVAEGTPVIALGQRPRGMRIPLVTNRPTESIGLAVMRLAELGHERVAYVGDSGEIGDFRTDLLTAASERLGLQFFVEEVPVDHDGDFFALAPRVLRDIEDARATAIFARYPYMAGLANAIAIRGKTIPRDFSLISFGDGEWLRANRPRISTLRAESGLIGEVAARVALEAMAGALIGRTYQPTDAVWEERESIGSPASSSRSRLVRFLGN